MNEKQRAEFDKWFTSQIDSEYCSPNVKALMAECWQAAIASVVVKLPDWSEYDTTRQAIEACADRIKDAGASHNEQ